MTAFIAVMVVLPVRLQGYTELLMSNDYAQYEKVVNDLKLSFFGGFEWG